MHINDGERATPCARIVINKALLARPYFRRSSTLLSFPLRPTPSHVHVRNIMFFAAYPLVRTSSAPGLHVLRPCCRPHRPYIQNVFLVINFDCPVEYSSGINIVLAPYPFPTRQPLSLSVSHYAPHGTHYYYYYYYYVLPKHGAPCTTTLYITTIIVVVVIIIHFSNY
jgi:hypothetical protein